VIAVLRTGGTQLNAKPTFYPNTRDVRAAAPLRVKAGEEIEADLAMPALPAGTLTINLKTGEPAPLAVEVSPDGFRPDSPRPALLVSKLDVKLDGPGGSSAWERVESAPERAVLTGIAPGEYTIRASQMTPEGSNSLFGRERVMVGAGETVLSISLTKPPLVTGTLRMEGSDRVIPRGAVIELRNETDSQYIRRPVAEDGSFLFEGIAPGQYTPVLTSPAATIRLRGFTVNGTLSKDLWVDITRSIRLDLTAVTKAGVIEGAAYRNGAPQSGVFVMLAPRQESSSPYDYLPFLTDSDGSFEFTGVTAGDYLLFAVEDSADFEYANPAAVRPYLAKAQAVRVDSDQIQKVRLELP
jgi:hypothetical protein